LIQLATESVYGVVDEVQDLVQAHYDEIAMHKERIPLAPDWQRYSELEQVGNLVTFTARDEGRLVGYSVFLINQMLHYVTTRLASNDVLFLHKDYRKGMAGVRLIKYSEQQLKERGVDKVVWHIKFHHDFRPILHRMGYGDEEVIVGKIL
jgi:GNAT superfamily N-acetyltransferase